MIQVTDTLAIDDSEIDIVFTHASGPGGQNINKVSTAAQLRFDILGSASLPDDVRERLIELAGRRVNRDGVLVLNARRFRSQERNRQDALDRLTEMVRQAAVKPKVRRRTRVPDAARKRRLETKRRRSQTKRRRGRVSPPDD